jgi:Flp pilus assembly protein TadG
MLALLRRFIADDRAAAATEMALSVPLLAGLIFGSLELGTYFWAEHKLIKAVRDGARYAARQPYDDYPSCTPSSGLIDETRNVTRTGQIANGGTPRLGYWTDPATITVTADCDHPGTYAGVYDLSPIGAPVVTVAASVPFPSMFGTLGIMNVNLEINARAEAPVYGL